MAKHDVNKTRQKRNEAMKEDRSEGMTYEAIARKYDISLAQTMRILIKKDDT